MRISDWSSDVCSSDLLDGGRLDAGLLAVALFLEFDLVGMGFRPANIHSQQHRGLVLAFGAAGAGMHLEEGIVGIGLARQQAFQPRLGDLVAQADRKSTRLNSSHYCASRMPSSA